MLSPYDVPTLWVASKEKAIAKAIAAFIEPFLGSQIQHQFDETRVRSLRNCDEIHSILDGQDKSSLLNTAFILDLTTAGMTFNFDVREEAASFFRPAELLLRYPEVYWIFVVDRVPDWRTTANPHSPSSHESGVTQILRNAGVSPNLLERHFVRIDRLIDAVSRLQGHAGGFRTLFDPTGIRFLTIAASSGEHNAPRADCYGLPDASQFQQIGRRSYGISIEDEVSYAFLNGYLLYKHGCSTFIITTLSEFLNMSQYTQNDSGTAPAWHIIEDVELSFPDATTADHRLYALSPGPNMTDVETLAARSDRTAMLRAAATRTVLTTVRLDLKSLRAACGPQCNTLTKPHRGFYDEHILGHAYKQDIAPVPRHPRLVTNVLVSFQFLFFALIWFRWVQQQVRASYRVVAHYFSRIVRGMHSPPSRLKGTMTWPERIAHLE